MSIATFAELKTAVANWASRDDLTSRIPEFIALAEDRIGLKLRVRALEATRVLPMKARVAVTAAEVTGTGDAIILTPATAVTAYTTGDRYQFVAEASNTGATVVNISAVSSQNIYKYTGGVLGALEADDIYSGMTVRLYYDGTQFQLVERGQIPLPTGWLAGRRFYIDGSPAQALRILSPQNFWSRYLASDTAKPQAFTIEGNYLTLGPDPDGAYNIFALYYRKLTALSASSDTNWVLTNARGLYLYGALLEMETFLENDEAILKWAKLWEQCLDDAHEADEKDRYSGAPLEALSDVPAI